MRGSATDIHGSETVDASFQITGKGFCDRGFLVCFLGGGVCTLLLLGKSELVLDPADLQAGLLLMLYKPLEDLPDRGKAHRQNF